MFNFFSAEILHDMVPFMTQHKICSVIEALKQNLHFIFWSGVLTLVDKISLLVCKKWNNSIPKNVSSKLCETNNSPLVPFWWPCCDNNQYSVSGWLFSDAVLFISFQPHTLKVTYTVLNGAYARRVLFLNFVFDGLCCQIQHFYQKMVCKIKFFHVMNSYVIICNLPTPVKSKL